MPAKTSVLTNSDTDGKNVRKDRILMSCLECKKDHWLLPCYSTKKFCDRKCSAQYNSRLRKKREVKPCEHCGEGFESLVKAEQRYCSTDCSAQGRKKTLTLTCDECGGSYERHQYKYAQSRFCGNSCKEKARAKSKAKNQMSDEEYQSLLAAQDHKCAICKKPETGRHERSSEKTVKLAKDHCHETGKWRGLLCRKCNMALGLFGDDVAALLRAADYVTNGGVHHVPSHESRV